MALASAHCLVLSAPSIFTSACDLQPPLMTLHLGLIVSAVSSTAGFRRWPVGSASVSCVCSAYRGWENFGWGNFVGKVSAL